MSQVSKNPSTSNDALSRIDALCSWIEQNHAQDIGWEDLTRQSGFTHKELIAMFQTYKKTTPMWFIRQVRESAQVRQDIAVESATLANMLKANSKSN